MENRKIERKCKNCRHFVSESQTLYGTIGRCVHTKCSIKNMPDNSTCDFFENKEDIQEREISHPAHYCEGRKYEPVRVIQDWGLSFCLGNALKYIARAGRKGEAAQDLQKAKRYLEFEIEEIENESIENQI